MNQNIPDSLLNKINHLVLEHLKETSAHSDVGEELIKSVKPLGDVQVFCPDPQNYRYILASTKNIIFAFATGMNSIVFRLDNRLKPRALTTGATAYPECGDEWVSFILFRDDWPKFDLPFWALKAYVFARETNIGK